MDEYEQLQRLRELWSRAIMTWSQIFIPLGAAIIAFFISQLPNFIDRGWGHPFLVTGYGLFSTCMIFWRWIVHRSDKGIVGLYSRMLELEKKNEMETQAAYYFRNLNKASINYLANKLDICSNELRNKDFRQFKTKISEKHNPHELLLEVWDKFLYNSVTSRGHSIQDWVVIFLLGVFPTVITWGSLNGWLE